MTSNQTQLQAEWTVLQQQFDSYEKFSLLIKLCHIIPLMILMALNSLPLVLIFFSSTLWLLDGIWKTFQFRIEDRLLVIENAIKHQTNDTAYQFNSTFLAERPNTITLVISYLKNALRPTVAYPHVVLIALYFVGCLIPN